MKITKVEAIPIRLPQVTTAIDGSQDDCIIKIHTDEGIIGIGEVDAPPTVVKAIVDAPTSHGWARGLAEVLIGEDPFDVEQLWNKMYQSTIYYGRRGVVISAMSGIDIALWDTIGKASGKPIHKLLGGSYHSKIRPYASIYPFGNTQAEITKKARKYVGDHFTAAKFQCAPFGSDPRYDVKMVKAARDGLGVEAELMVDACMCWTNSAQAIKTAKAIERFDVYWLEAPLPPDDLDGYAKLADACDMRIAGGDLNLATRYEFADLMDRGRVDVVQPDITHSGGITELKKISELALLKGRDFVPHSYKTGLSIAATLQLLASVPNATFLEFSVNESILRRSLIKQQFWPDDEGYIQVPDAPGLGVVLNDEIVRKYKI